MEKKNFIPVIIGTVILTCVLAISLNNNIIMGNADIQSYKISMNNEKNKFDVNNQSSIIKTELGNNITFNHSGINNSDTSWHVLNTEGYFYNTTPIHGLEKITIGINGEGASYRIYYCNYFDKDEDFVNYKDFNQTASFNFDEQFPNYFKVVNIGESNLDITSIDIDLACKNYYPIVAIASEDESKGTVSGTSGPVFAGSTCEVTATPATGCIFIGWYDGDELVSDQPIYSFTIDNNDVSLVARFSLNRYEFTVKTDDSTKGSVIDVSGTYTYLSEVTVTATCNETFAFAGWHNGTTIVSMENPYTFKMTPYNLDLTAVFWTSVDKESWDKAHGVIPVLDETNNTVSYGLYPQSYFSDENIISELEKIDENGKSKFDGNGYYFYNNEFYIKAKATPQSSNYKFDDNTTLIVAETYYWFKCEPLIWDVLTINTDGSYYLLSEKCINFSSFAPSYNRTIGDKTIYENNYEYSNVRAKLNGYDGSAYKVQDFTGIGIYDLAFALESKNILTTHVDNSLPTTDEEVNDYVCNDTYDKVFLPSRADYKLYFKDDEDSEGLTANEKRRSLTTDYARAIGSTCETQNESYLNCGQYWARSPRPSSGGTFASNIGQNGAISGVKCYIKYESLRPAINLVIE